MVLLLVLILFELLLQISFRLGLFKQFYENLDKFNYDYDQISGRGLYYSHPYLAYDMKPFFSTDWNGGQTINSYGFRGEEFSIEKLSKTYRIVAIGGSTTYDVTVGDKYTYPYLLEQELNKRLRGSGKEVEVLNAGIVNGTSAESLTRLLFKVLDLKPDMIIFYEGFNDIVPRLFNNFRADYYNFRKIPEEENGQFFNNFFIYKIIDRATKAITYEHQDLTNQTWKYVNFPVDDWQSMESNFNNTSAEVYERNVRQIINISRSNNIKIVLSTFAFNDNKYNRYANIPDKIWGAGIGENNVVIRKLADEYRLPLIKLDEELDGKEEFFFDSIHLNADGNLEKARIFTETIYPYVK